jgi:MoaA/NifB/PqqE/SkfB family radical SAM enzyme
MREWSSPYNPFNSMKALVHAPHFEAILKGIPKAPLVINMDLTNGCNYNCRFCMFGGQRERTDKQGEEFRKSKDSLPLGYAQTLPQIWKNWGSKAVCLAGGGEPSLHPDCLEFIIKCNEAKLDLGFVTNGLRVNNPEWYDAVQGCKFVGFSMDAGTPEDYAQVKGVKPEFFNVVLNNMKQIRERGKVQIGYKFVLDEKNYRHIYRAAALAKEHGATHFQFRPAIDQHKWEETQLRLIHHQIAKAQENLETPDYKVMGVMHKFNPDLTKKHNFDKCRATMLTSTWCADGWTYMCTDTRGCDWSKLVRHYPDPNKVIEFWGGKEHFDKVKQIDFKRKCDRCTLAPYNEMFEKVFMEDLMDRNLI